MSNVPIFVAIVVLVFIVSIVGIIYSFFQLVPQENKIRNMLRNLCSQSPTGRGELDRFEWFDRMGPTKMLVQFLKDQGPMYWSAEDISRVLNFIDIYRSRHKSVVYIMAVLAFLIGLSFIFGIFFYKR